MGRMSEKRKEELQAKYGDAIAPIDAKYMEKARGLSARYILFANKNKRNGYCEKCGKDVVFKSTKHLEDVECPNCGTKLKAIHTWRRKCEYNIDWYVIGQAFDSETMLMRYIRVEHNEDFTKVVEERAREIYDYKHGWSYEFSYYGNEWRVNDRHFFTEFTMNFHRRKNCCIDAKCINNVKAEVRKLDSVKYFDKLDNYYGIYVYARDNVKMLMSAGLYEKLEKIGLSEIAMNDFKNYWKPMKYKRSESSVTKILGINKGQLKVLRKSGTKKTLDFIREYKDIDVNLLDEIISNNATEQWDTVNKFPICNYVDSKVKLFRYLVKNKINERDYFDYIDMMEKLNYKIDKSYLYPKDFKKEHDRVTDEYSDAMDAEKLKKMGKQSALIKKISDGLRKMPDLKEFLDGSNGLLVYVPESAKELLREGRRLHNCIGSYVDRVAQGKTFVFFVRRLDAPDAPFVAFEYSKGKVIQCRADHNRSVTDTKIINFVDAFVNQLRKSNVMCAAA